MNVQPRVCCEGRHLCDECKAHATRHAGGKSPTKPVIRATVPRRINPDCPIHGTRAQAATSRPTTVRKDYDAWMAHFNIPPDGYGLSAPVTPTDLGPDYNPRGVPPDGYQLALQKRSKEKNR